MKTNRIIFSLLIICFFLGLSSCVNPIDSEDPAFFTLNETTLVFDRIQEEKSISIKTNQKNWVATSPEEGKWITLTVENSLLSVRVNENKEALERSSYILIQGGGAVVKVLVRQSGASPIVEVEKSEIEIPAKGENKVLSIYSTLGEWQVSPEDPSVDWIHIKNRPNIGKLEIKVDENKSIQPRQLKLIVRSGDVLSEILVSQKGADKYILPYIVQNYMDPIMLDLYKFEINRESFSLNKNNTDHEFVTKYSMNPRIKYTFEGPMSKVYKKAWTFMWVESDKEAMLKEYDEFMTMNGFIKSSNSTPQLIKYISEDKNLKVEVQNMSDEHSVNIDFLFSPRQNKEYPTFSSFPFNIDMIENPEWTLDKIKEYEKGLGFEYADDSQPFYEWYIFRSSQESDYSMVSYSLSEGVVWKIEKAVKDTSKIYWTYDNNYVMTKEFDALMESKGFTYVGVQRYKFTYQNASKKLQIAVAQNGTLSLEEMR